MIEKDVVDSMGCKNLIDVELNTRKKLHCQLRHTLTMSTET